MAVNGFATKRVLTIAAAIALVGLIGTVLAIWIDPTRALLGYLAAYATVFAIASGATILLLIGHAANTRWIAAPRRVAESVACVFPLLLLLFIPIACGVAWIYTWVDLEALPSRSREVVEAKRSYLSVAPFIVRGVIYILVIGFTAEWLRRRSMARDRIEALVGEPEDLVRPERRFSSFMLVPVGLALTFASFDWLMSLQPEWPSTMFGVYYFAGGFAAALALVVVLSARLARRIDTVLTGNHFHALGRLLFAFVVFWAYTAYFQGFLIQIANRPNEVTFYVARTQGGWYGVLWAILIARFILPFFLLLPRGLKYFPGYVSAVAIVVLVGHVIEVYWLTLPSRVPAFSPSWHDLFAYMFVVGACVAFAAWRQRGVPVASAGDPFLAEGRRYESPT